MTFSIIFSTLLVTLLLTAYLYVKHLYSYWKRHGVPYKTPSFPFGNLWNTFLQNKSFNEDLAEIYNESSEPYLGIFTPFQPALLVRDPEIIKDMLITQFHNFDHRGFVTNVDVDPMADNIFLQDGEKGKRARGHLSPAFTMGKLKGAFDIIVDSGAKLENYVTKNADTTIEMRDLLARFFTNVISSVAFGLEINCIENPDEEFRKHGQRFFAPCLKKMLRVNLPVMMPSLTKWASIRWADKDTSDFMIDAVKQNVEYRVKNNIDRKDAFQLLMQTKKTDQNQSDDTLTVEEIAAQGFIALTAGFETSSAGTSFCLYELAKQPELQQKAFNEIVCVLQKYDDKLTYEAVAEMKFIGQCIDESLRRRPPFGVVYRKCLQNYKIPGTEAIIDKGTMVFFSTTGLQNDSKYYDEPAQFNPERYAESQSLNKGFAEMPNLVFGDGPRKCLGQQLALLQMKIALIVLLRKFRFELGDQHENTELRIDPLNFITASINGINLKVTNR